MSIGAVGAPVPGVGSAVSSTPVAEGKELHEHDGDADDAKKVASPAQSVNLSGQATGTLIHSVA